MDASYVQDMRTIIAAAALLCACGAPTGETGDASGPTQGSDSGPTVIAHPDWVSGSRLKVRVLTSADGLRTFHGLYDSRLRVNCSERTTTDGVVRCVPEGALVTSWYLDSQCRYSVAASQDQQDQVYAIAPTSSYPSITRVMMIDGPHLGDVYLWVGSSCVVANIPAGWRTYSVRPELPPTDFVQLSEDVAQ